MSETDVKIRHERGLDGRPLSDLENVDWDAVMGRRVHVQEQENGRRSVGIDSFEPRLEIDYKVDYLDSGGSIKNTALIVLEKGGRTISAAYLQYSQEPLS